MTPARDKITILMMLTRQLTQVLDAETEVLRRVRLSELADLQAEKQALADVYTSELADLRRDPERLAAVGADTREELEFATRRFQDAASRNTLALQAAHAVVERALQLINENLAGAGGYAAGGGQTRGEVVPFAIDRTC